MKNKRNITNLTDETNIPKKINYKEYRPITLETTIAHQGQCIRNIRTKSRKITHSINQLIKRTKNICQRINVLEEIHSIPASLCRSNNNVTYNSKTREILENRNNIQLIVVPVQYTIKDDTTYYRAYKNYVINPVTGLPVLGHPLAQPGYHVFYTDAPVGNVLDISQWTNVQLL